MAAGSVGEVFAAFFKLGLTAFGGPTAHFGYFHREFVERRKWLDAAAYADTVALCQCLPGPASSQTGMAIGLGRAGVMGMIAAWAAFTLPSAVIMAAAGIYLVGTGSLAAGPIAGLKAAAVAVVALALASMARGLAPDIARKIIAVLAGVFVLALGGPAMQILAIIGGAVAGFFLPSEAADPRENGTGSAGRLVALSRRGAIWCLGAFAALLLLLPLAANLGAGADLFDRFYRAGALVFGTGHVVLPLLEAEVVSPGLVDRELFLAGYGLTQAMPGPILSFAAYLGAVANVPPDGVAGALIATVAIFAPSFLLVAGTLPFWHGLSRYPAAQRALRGVNAAVLGLLGAAFVDPVVIEGVTSPATFAIALAALVLLWWGRVPVVAVVGLATAAGWILI